MANEETTLQFMMQVLDQYSSMAKNMSEAARQKIARLYIFAKKNIKKNWINH